MEVIETSTPIPKLGCPLGYTDLMNEDPLRERKKWLEAEKKRLFEELRNYPSPVAACDQQLAELLEKQALITAELNHIRRSGASDSVPNP